MLKNIIKEYNIDEIGIQITLEDPRDSYVEKEALGVIGNIYLSPQGVFLIEQADFDERKNRIRESIVLQVFSELFGTKEYNPLSREYYDKLKAMIDNKTLSALGYTEVQNQEEDDFYFRKKH